jgi:hypothetical protein
MAEAIAFRDAMYSKDIVKTAKAYNVITANHSEFFLAIISTAYNIGDIDASCCNGWIPNGAPKQ